MQMHKMTSFLMGALAAIMLILPSADALAATPSFTLAWSEYPSWSTFGVAHEYGLINGREGKLGPIEKRWGVDIVLKEADYDSCLVMYGAGQTDAVAITNMDVLPPSLSLRSVAVLPTSTSYGADALIVPNSVTSLSQLRGKKVYGLAKTVSEYMFVRNLEKNGEQEGDYTFSNMDPAAAALAMQQRNDNIAAIAVWNPFVLQTLRKRSDVHVLADSTSIPGEIIDMVVVSEKSLNRRGGKKFAAAVVDTFYAVSNLVENPATSDDATLALGEKFSNLGLADMREVLKATQFYKTPQDGLAVFNGQQLRKTMTTVVEFCVSHDVVDRKPTVGYGAKGKRVRLRFDPSFMQQVQSKGVYKK